MKFYKEVEFMFYEEYGSRELPTIIMLHGGGVVHSFFNQYILSNRFHLVIPHLYGNGRESHVQYDPIENVKAIAKIINKIGKNKVSIVGFSIGAQITIPLLCNYEHLFSKAIMISPWLIKSEKTLKKFSKLAALTYPMYKSKLLMKLQLKTLGLNELQLNECISYFQVMKKENLLAFWNNGINICDYPEFINIQIPMLAITGKKEIPDMAKSVKYLGEVNPNCKVEIWENYNHNIPFKNPERLNKTIVDFLSS
jgi:pimeloyl-ACP methyl ester carboxylesterase